MGDIVETTVVVRYAETDQMGVVYHANYLIWFEVARNAFCRARGIEYAEMERRGYFLPIVEASCRYFSPARYDEEITLKIRASERKRKTLRFHYAVYRGEQKLAEGETLQVLVNAEMRPVNFPDDIAALFDEPDHAASSE